MFVTFMNLIIHTWLYVMTIVYSSKYTSLYKKYPMTEISRSPMGVFDTAMELF